MVKSFLCKECSNKCVISIDIYGENKEYMEVKGHKCEKGIEYAKIQKENNKDIFTTIVRIKGSDNYNVVPVKSSKPIDKSLWVECSKALSMLHVGAPIKIGDAVCHNLLNTGVDIVCTKNIEKYKG